MNDTSTPTDDMWAFSESYRLCRYDLRYRDEIAPQIDRTEFDALSYQLDAWEPLVVKIGTRYLPIYRGGAIPHRTVVLPTSEADEQSESDDVEILIPQDQQRTKALLWPEGI